MNRVRTSTSFARVAVFACALAGALFAHAQGGTAMPLNAVTEASVTDMLAPTSVGNRTPRLPGEPAPPKPHADMLITFLSGKVELTPDSKTALDVVAGAMRNDRLKSLDFVIEGHADPRKARGVDNLTLSQRRADKVRDYLVANGNVEEKRLRPVGKGDKEPLDAAHPEAPENRRVTFVTDTTAR